jgi:disulfide bond formation protein DsbB
MHLKPYSRNPLFSDPPAFSALRICALLGFVLCIGSLGFAYYLEHHQYVQPCPLCMLQRGLYLLLALFFCFCAIPRTMPLWLSRSLSAIIGIIAILGIGIAGRQIWLEHLPPGEAPLCSASLDRLLEIYPILEVFRRILTTSGECARVMLRIVGLSLAEWSLVLFEVILLLSLYQWKTAEN